MVNRLKETNIINYCFHFLAYRSCLKPCTEVSYITSVDKFFLSSSEMGDCTEEGGKLMLQIGRYIEIEIVRLKCR